MKLPVATVAVLATLLRQAHSVAWCCTDTDDGVYDPLFDCKHHKKKYCVLTQNAGTEVTGHICPLSEFAFEKEWHYEWLWDQGPCGPGGQGRFACL
ncbi:unnamed protein product [Zymoseptoria tritici ST99CH_3D7]|uniref:Secreted protein n=1 Tax=Zymoseptoria tritici (strain ST99CH_3D7) TaxID=1276538 RepID=A0A1X7S4T7_ZYMT9|nr:unnamed protein product [Zymoseptoria tritici ST99CH_3D7]